MSGNFLTSKKGKTVLGFAYGWGAAVVILGALFKIQHWEGAGAMLTVGLLTEAVIFFVSAFEPVHMETDWSLVYPELKGGVGEKKSKSVTEQLDDMLSKSKVGTELIDSLGKGFKSLNDNVAGMSNIADASVATKEYSDNLKKANSSVVTFGTVAIEAATTVSEMTKAYGGLTNSIKSLADASSDAESYKTEMAKLNANLKSLNQVYGGMLSAMNVNPAK